MATKKELLARAKEINLTGRHDMTKDQLEAALNKANGKNPHGNKPFQYKVYGFSGKINVSGKLAPQKQGILIAAAELTQRQGGYIGRECVAYAKSKGYIKSGSDDAVLYAYYARELEALGVHFLGFYAPGSVQEFLMSEAA